MSFALSVTQPAPACSEHELVAAVRRGDDEAFGELYSRYRTRIGTYIFGMVGDHARAEDIAQEVFISALRRLRDTERPIAFKPWIYEIAKNACIDEFRRSRRGREVPLAPGDESTVGERELPSSAPTPDAAVENKQSLADLRGAFHVLSENHHKVIVMRELEGLSYSEIGERLGMSRPMVESTLFRARKRLTAEYDELVSGRRCLQVQTVIDTSDQRALRKLGIRERRLLARHISHCQPCRRHARMAGVDDSVFQAPTVIGKIAALLPIPWLRWRRGGGDDDGVSITGPHSFAALQSLQTVARFADPASPSVGVSRTAAAVAAVALAGVGGGVVAVTSSHSGHSPVPAPVPAHVARPSSHRAGAVARASLRSPVRRPRAARSRSGGHAPRPGAAPAATPHGSTSATAPASAARSSTTATGSTATSTASGTSRQVNKVLSGATSAATGGATHLGPIHLPGVPPIPAPALPKVPKVIQLPKVAIPVIPKLKLPNPLSLLSSQPNPTSQLPQVPRLGAAAPPPVTVPQLPTVTNPLKQLLSH